VLEILCGNTMHEALSRGMKNLLLKGRDTWLRSRDGVSNFGTPFISSNLQYNVKVGNKTANINVKKL